MPVTMPGGAAAIRQPWRMGVAWAQAAGVEVSFEDERQAAVAGLAERGVGPVTTSMGRLFDALAALLGLRTEVSYEAQAAVALEASARLVPRSAAPEYPFEVGYEAGQLILDPRPLISACVEGRAAGVPLPVLAAGVHRTIGRATADAAAALARRHGVGTVALSGGVFQNERLSQTVEELLAARGLEVLTHSRVPANDGGISFGQAAVAAARG
jgi:hydrogenase maturation protein HypF